MSAHQENVERMLPSEWQYPPVDQVKEIRSLNAICSTSFSIKNSLTKPVNVQWISYEGALVLYMRLNVGGTRDQHTFATHPWLVSDDDGNNLLLFTAGTKQMEKIVIDSESVAAIGSTGPGGGTDQSWVALRNALGDLPWEVRYAPVDQASDFKSTSCLCTTEFTITNELQKTVNVFWLSYDGQPVQYMRLNAGESRDQHTYATHPWLVKDDDDNGLLLFIAGVRQKEIVTIK